MKKLFLVFASVMMVFALSACGQSLSENNTSNTSVQETTYPTSNEQTTTIKLNLPFEISVAENIITFSHVEHADKYNLYIYDLAGLLVGEYNITNQFDLSLLLSLGDYKLRLQTIGQGFLDSELSDDIYFSITGPSQVEKLEGDLMNQFEYIRWLGRTYYDEEDQSRYFYFTASGFEVGFYGTELIGRFKATHYDDSDRQAYLIALVDGEEDPTKGLLIKLDKALDDYVLAENLDYGYHTVKLLKRSEATDSDTALTSIETDGYFTSPPKAKSFKLQFIAASSSAGYGNLGNSSTPKTSANSDGLRAFAYLTSYMLDADISIFSASGWGVSRGWNTGGMINESLNIPYAYQYLGINSLGQVLTQAGQWDSSNYSPDVIVVNLGTNDFTSTGYNTLSAEDRQSLIERFKEDYISFLLLLNNMHPNALIIVAYGLMNETYYLETPTLEIVEEVNRELNTHQVYSFLMEGAGTHGNAYGSNSHPNVGTSINVAEDLANFIREMTGRDIVREIYG